MPVEDSQVLRVGCDHSHSVRPSGDHDRRVHDLGGVGDTAELSCRSGVAVVKGEHPAQRRPEEPGKAGLAGPVPPSLGHDPCRYQQQIVMFWRSGDYRDDTAAAALKPVSAPRCQGPPRSPTERPVSSTAFTRTERTAGLCEHLLQQRPQIVELGLLLQRTEIR